jgi:hypothetical protein
VYYQSFIKKNTVEEEEDEDEVTKWQKIAEIEEKLEQLQHRNQAERYSLYNFKNKLYAMEKKEFQKLVKSWEKEIEEEKKDPSWEYLPIKKITKGQKSPSPKPSTTKKTSEIKKGKKN